MCVCDLESKQGPLLFKKDGVYESMKDGSLRCETGEDMMMEKNEFFMIRFVHTKECVARDNVNHPTHYTSHPSGVECIQVTEHYNFNVGNAIKYLWRAGLKKEADKEMVEKQVEDLEKAAWYVQREIARVKLKG